MSRRRVVVTGLGVVSPVGSALERAWDNLTAGRSGVRAIDSFDASGFPVRISGSVADFESERYVAAKDWKKMDAFIRYGIGAAVDALRDAELEATEENAGRIGVAIGSGIGGLPYIENNYGAFLKGGARRISPFFVPSTIINMVAGDLSIEHGLRGPNFSVVSACATGTHSIGIAARAIAYGDADAMVAGGAEMATCPLGIGGFASARALCASRNDDPERASRPWDAGRDGFVLGDGAGVLVLEEYEAARSARRRDLLRAGRLRHDRRRPPHDPAGSRRGGRGALHARGPRRRRDGPGRRGLHQRPRHLDPRRRPGPRPRRSRPCSATARSACRSAPTSP